MNLCSTYFRIGKGYYFDVTVNHRFAKRSGGCEIFLLVGVKLTQYDELLSGRIGWRKIGTMTALPYIRVNVVKCCATDPGSVRFPFCGVKVDLGVVFGLE